jgi:stage V sporulation protein D (sporulation-specific penicillin-binding protein)
MTSVVAEGTGRNAQVKGYSVGGKTGTSEDGVNTNKYITSFVGVADTENPELAIVVILYNPTGEGGHQGGAVGAPVAGEILGEVLPYLEVSKNSEEIKESVTMEDVTGKEISEAKKILDELGLEYEIANDKEAIERNYNKSITKKRDNHKSRNKGYFVY